MVPRPNPRGNTMKKLLIAAAFTAAIAAPAFAEDELMTACMAAMESIELPEGATAADMAPNCECLVEGADDAERANLLEVGASQAGGDTEAAFSDDAQAAIDACFPATEE